MAGGFRLPEHLRRLSCFDCGRVQLSEGQLPEAFEGEERSVPGVGDVLQLVSGRQLLGVVRERQDACLPGLNQPHIAVHMFMLYPTWPAAVMYCPTSGVKALLCAVV